jgi:site-specific DNA-methyltransferase (adenine-specific)
MKYPEDFINKIIQGDCLEIMKEIPDNSIDTIITDPPYGLSFMGKEWDSFGTDLQKYQEWTRQWAKEALRVAKPGATLLCFGGTRTWHRLACGLEDAGWVIKDTLMWLYGSGFPKATDISKQMDKMRGAEREVIGENPNVVGRTRPKSATNCLGAGIKTELTTPATPEAKLWNGWKSHGLKPAWEPIIMAMKPNEGSYAENALRWGVAGLNIDGGRIGTEKVVAHHAPKGTFAGGELDRGSDTNYYTNQGRFPANLLLDEESAEMLDEQSGISGSKKFSKGSIRHYTIWNSTKGKGIKCNAPDNYGDIGGASRFFYVAKASRSEREMGLDGFEEKHWNDGRKTPKDFPSLRKDTPRYNYHPTVKPLKLMEYLCLLTKTPTGGIVLDPFAGSGTTCMAAKKVGRDFIGIEKELEYCKIAEARLKAIPKLLKL